jgi:hypothetical protein
MMDTGGNSIGRKFMVGIPSKKNFGGRLAGLYRRTKHEQREGDENEDVLEAK